MGSFYVNFAVRSGDVRKVVEVLQACGRKAIVLPAENGVVMVVDEEAEEQGAIHEAATALSQGANAPVLAVLNHDDDILQYWLFEGGGEVDAYNSAPDYFAADYPEELRSDMPIERGGNAGTLCATHGKIEAVAKVEKILRNDTAYTFAKDRHLALVRALGLPESAVGLGYAYVINGEFPGGVEEKDVLRVG